MAENLLLVTVISSSDHPLRSALFAAVVGRFPAVDGRVEVVPPDDVGTQAVVEFTGHSFVLTDRRPDDGLFVGVDAFGGATRPRMLTELAGRREISIELTDAVPGQGVGRRLVTSALATVDPDQFVFAQVAPGNAASVRMFLAAGFVPIGSEVLIERHP